VACPHALAERVRQIEARDLQVACGYQDFYMAVWGGLNLMDFRDKQGLGADPHEPWAMVEPLMGYLRGAQIPLWLATHRRNALFGRGTREPTRPLGSGRAQRGGRHAAD
jgi:hypothetical protein